MNEWKKVLIAVDDTPTSENALQYAADILGKLADTRICLLHIYPEPPPDYYRTGGSLDDYQQEKEKKAAVFISRAEKKLILAGIAAQAITSMFRMADHATISQAILETQEREGYGTIIVAKRGVSKAEEFLFGSISSALVHHCRDCSVWVVG
jgi:nucleotide-binding universal stress UspA family protein